METAHTPPAQPTVWDHVREDYLAGDTATVVADRYGITERSVRRRAAKENWRRSDDADGFFRRPGTARNSLDDLVQQYPELGPIVQQNADDAVTLVMNPNADDLRRVAFRRAAEATAERKPAGAAAWLRVVALLDRCDYSLSRVHSPVNSADWLRAAHLRAVAEGLSDSEDEVSECHESHGGHGDSAT